MKNEEKLCSKCTQLVVCSLFNDIQGTEEGCIEIYSNTVKHLAGSHKKYFLNWYTMLEHEFKDQKQFDAEDFLAKVYFFQMENKKFNKLVKENVFFYQMIVLP